MSLAPRSDEELAHRAAIGDREAFSTLVRRYAGPVFGLCRRLLGDEAEAEDRVQEAFLKAYEHLDRYDPARRFAPWLFRIAQNACIDGLRARRAWGPLPDELPSAAAPPLGWEERDALDQAVATLPAKQRAVLHLKYAEGLSAPEIGARLDMTPGAVRIALHRAIHALRTRLA